MEPTSLLGYTGKKKSSKYFQKVLAPMIGKTQHKHYKGHSSGFSTDYSNAIETMDESEGFGSSGRVDIGTTAVASQLYTVEKSVVKCGVFGVPLEVIQVGKLRRSERREWKLRLRVELEQVQLLYKKIASRSVNGVGKMPPVQSLQRQSGDLSVPAKKRVSSGQSSGPALKRDTSGRFESVAEVVSTNTSHVMLMRQCASLLQKLMTHQFGHLFNTPVDVVKFNIPDYFTVIKHPMDLGTVKKRIASGVYSSPIDFYSDVRLTFSNAMTYNPSGNEVHNMAAALNNYFEVRWKSIEKKLQLADSKAMHPNASGPVELEASKPMPPAKKRKVSSMEHKVKPEIIKRVMTDEEKHKLSKDLESFTEIPLHIIDFLRENTFNTSQAGEDEIEVDIDDLSDDALFTLQKLVNDHLREKLMNQEKAEHREMEILNESGLSNSSMQHCKGNNTAEEDVDIGGNDPPVSSYPPVEIEKEGGSKKNKSNSSSSSSSDSGSSSSDSDSGSSSESDSDGAKVLLPEARNKETLSSGEVLDQKPSDLVDANDGNQAVSGLDQFEQTSQHRTISTEAESCHEGNNPSERQASPDKLYRQALLSRFADTILKAREKIFVEGEKGDPENLRREREKLERQQREEKARLQAEARAAEAARIKAEAEYAVEAKRKRELEREAARLALTKMEKSVEINENRQFLEELEMLTVGSGENLPSSVDETSPVHSEEGMGSFRLQGCTNPLEQLGLFMKEDEDEDEDEGEANTVQDPLTDVEEGEID